MATETFGVVLQSLRKTRDMSQDELAAETQVSRTSVQNWENDRTRPRRAEFRRLSAALGMTVDELKARAEQFAQPVPAGDLPQLLADLEDVQLQRRNLDSSPARGHAYKVVSQALDVEIADLQRRIQAAKAGESGDTPRAYGS